MDYCKKAGKQQTQRVVCPNMMCAVNPLGKDCWPNWLRAQHLKNAVDKQVSLKTGYPRFSLLIIIFTFPIAVFWGISAVSPYFQRNPALRISEIDVQRCGRDGLCKEDDEKTKHVCGREIRWLNDLHGKNTSNFHQKHMAIAVWFTLTWARLRHTSESNHTCLVARH